MEENIIEERSPEEEIKKEKKPFIQKVPFGVFSLICLGFTYAVACTIGVLVVPVIFCIVFVLPHGVVFAILDIAIRKKKVVPIISLVFSLNLIFGFLFIIGMFALEIISESVSQIF